MKQLLLITGLLTLVLYSEGQILKVSTSASTIATQVPGYSQVSTISTRTFSYTPSTQPTPIDEDSTTEDDRIFD